jgi:hypothetical protein
MSSITNLPVGSSPNTNTTTTGTSSTSSSDVTVYTLNQIQGIATTAFEDALGREPTQAELNGFLTSLNKFAKANPATSSGSQSATNKATSKAKQKGTGNNKTDIATNTRNDTSTSTSTSTSGVDVSNFAQQQLQGSTEAQAVKTDSIFMNALNLLANQLGG